MEKYPIHISFMWLFERSISFWSKSALQRLIFRYDPNKNNHCLSNVFIFQEWVYSSLLYCAVCLSWSVPQIQSCLLTSTGRPILNQTQQLPRPLLASGALSLRQNSHTARVHIKGNHEHVSSMHFRERALCSRSGLRFAFCTSVWAV